MEENFTANYESPIGNLVITSDEDSISSCIFNEKVEESEFLPFILKQALIQIKQYFDGIRVKFDLQLFTNGTEFQEKVWKELVNIPYGQTITYSELAKRIGDEKAVRAVGNANGNNPISIIIPCHRVIGTDGSLVGYGGGIDRKKWLLDFEKS
jgi:methylated-DNA-[protein]-cysteine S-methyltransferase